jgi:hypothetical protein
MLFLGKYCNTCVLVMFRLILDGQIGTGPLILVLSHHSLVAAGGEAAARPGGGGGTIMAFYLDSHLT